MDTLKTLCAILISLLAMGGGFFILRKLSSKKEDRLDNGVTAIILVVIGIVTFVLVGFAYYLLDLAFGLYASYLWFADVGALSVFHTKLSTQFGLFAVGFVVSGFLLFLAALLPSKTYNVGRVAVGIAIALATILAFFLALVFAGDFDSYLKAWNAQPWGTTDPVLGNDYSFYAWMVPWLNNTWWWSFAVLAITSVWYGLITFLWHTFVGDKDIDEELLSPAIIRHVSFFLGIWCLLLGFGAYLKRIESLVYASPSSGFWMPIHIGMPFYGALIWLFLLLAALCFVNMYFKYWSTFVVLPVLWVAFQIVFGLTWWVTSSWWVEKDKFTYDGPYYQMQWEMTRSTWGINQIMEKPYQYTDDLSPETVKKYQEDLLKVRIIDPAFMKDALIKLQHVAPVYTFADVDTLLFNGQQLMVSALELDYYGKVSNQNWNSEHLQYTHSSGVSVSPVNKTDAQGQPLVQNSLLLTPERPQRYFGEMTQAFAIVNTLEPEFSGLNEPEDGAYHYQGQKGIDLNSGLNRFTFAWLLNDIGFLVNEKLTDQSKLLWRRLLTERIAPLQLGLTMDPDPYLFPGKDQYYWVWDAYTVTGKLPFVAEYNGNSYLHNAVKVAINAYDGSVGLYAFDPNDPVLRTQQAIYPIYKAWADFPKEVLPSVRYPEAEFTAKATIYKDYHVGSGRQLQLTQDRWDFALETQGDPDAAPSVSVPRYVFMRLPNRDASEFLLKIAFTPAGNQNLVSWLVVGNEGENYGKFTAFEFNRDILVPGPQVAEGNMNSHTPLSGQITLVASSGSGVLFGNLITLPIGEGDQGTLVYIKPMYVFAAANKVPSLRYVIIVSGEKIIWQPNLEAALRKLYAGEWETVTGNAALITQPEAGLPLQPSTPITPSTLPNPVGQPQIIPCPPEVPVGNICIAVPVQ